MCGGVWAAMGGGGRLRGRGRVAARGRVCLKGFWVSWIQIFLFFLIAMSEIFEWINSV